MLGTLTVKKHTFFKFSTKPAKDLTPEQKYEVYPGKQFTYSIVYPGKYEGHFQVHFSNPIAGVYTWFIYAPDVELTEDIRCAQVIYSL